MDVKVNRQVVVTLDENEWTTQELIMRHVINNVDNFYTLRQQSYAREWLEKIDKAMES